MVVNLQHFLVYQCCCDSKSRSQYKRQRKNEKEFAYGLEKGYHFKSAVVCTVLVAVALNSSTMERKSHGMTNQLGESLILFN